MKRIKIDQEGWKGIIGRDFNEDSVTRLSNACAHWLTNRVRQPEAVVGFDTRFGSERFANIVAKVFANRGVRVNMASGFCASPVLSYHVKKTAADIGIMVTAGQHSYEYNGINFYDSEGRPLPFQHLRDIENLINYDTIVDLDLIRLDRLIDRGLLLVSNFDLDYLEFFRERVKYNILRGRSRSVVFNPMFGATQSIVEDLFPTSLIVNKRQDLSFGGFPPEPRPEHSVEIMEIIADEDALKLGIILDGSGNSFGMIDEKGIFHDSNHMLLLTVYYLARGLKSKGKILVDPSATIRIEGLCRQFSLQVERTGFRTRDESGTAGKESILLERYHTGELIIRDQVPGLDALRTAVTLWQWMEETSSSLSSIMGEIIENYGSFHVSVKDPHWNPDKIRKIADHCRKQGFVSIGEKTVIRTEELDGFKFFLENQESVYLCINESQTQLKIYAESVNSGLADDLIIRIMEDLFAIQVH